MNSSGLGRFMRFIFAGLVLMFFSLTPLFSQTPSSGNSATVLEKSKSPMEMPLVDTTIKWVQLMLSPRPNYYEVKRAFEQHFGGVVPFKGQGYKIFKRWEYRVINHLDSAGFVNWNFGVIDELAGNLVSGGASAAGSGSGSGIGSGSSGSGSGSGSSSGSGGRHRFSAIQTIDRLAPGGPATS